MKSAARLGFGRIGFRVTPFLFNEIRAFRYYLLCYQQHSRFALNSGKPALCFHIHSRFVPQNLKNSFSFSGGGLFSVTSAASVVKSFLARFHLRRMAFFPLRGTSRTSTRPRAGACPPRSCCPIYNSSLLFLGDQEAERSRVRRRSAWWPPR